MANKVELLKRAYAELTFSERQEVIEFINKFESSSLEQKRTFSENFNKSLGPKSSNGCILCGK